MAHCGVDLYQMQVLAERTKDEDAHYVTDTIGGMKSLRMMFESPIYLAFPDLGYPALGDSDRGPLRGSWLELVGFHRYRDPKLAWLVQRDMPVGGASVGPGRIGFLHYYRYHYRYDNPRLDGKPITWQRPGATSNRSDSVIATTAATAADRYYGMGAPVDFVLNGRWTR